MKKYFMLIVLLIGVLSCRIDKAGSYEMKVFNEIFDNLVEEMGALSSFEIPPPIPFLDNNNPIPNHLCSWNSIPLLHEGPTGQ